MNGTSTLISQIRDDLKSASEFAKVLFESSAKSVSDRNDFSRRKMGDDGRGAVYVYYDDTMQAIYVGQTSRHVTRLYDQTSPHQKKEWWHGWKAVCFISLARTEDRLILETLLIIAYSPTHNVKPGSVGIETLFADLNPTNES